MLSPPGLNGTASDAKANVPLTTVGLYCWGSPNLPVVTPGGGDDPSGAPTILKIDGLGRTEGAALKPAVDAIGMNPLGDMCLSKLDGLTCYRGLTSQRFSELAGKAIVHISVGENHRCAATKSEMWCWGKNQYGELGNGNVEDSDRPAPVDLSKVHGEIKDIAAGDLSTCIATSDGAYCFGYGTWGQLGNGKTDATVSRPERVEGINGPVDRVAAGLDHFCAIAAGEVSCWGFPPVGLSVDAIGEGANRVQSTPLHVTLAGPAHDIALGNSFSCAATSVGVQCWGDNDRGQLGGATPDLAHSPHPTFVLATPRPL